MHRYYVVPLLALLAACSAPAPTAVDPAESERPPAAEYYEITQGGSSAVALDLPAPTGEARDAHGNRFGCAVSHFSYDDPILFPGEPGQGSPRDTFGGKSLRRAGFRPAPDP